MLVKGATDVIVQPYAKQDIGVINYFINWINWILINEAPIEQNGIRLD